VGGAEDPVSETDDQPTDDDDDEDLEVEVDDDTDE
jgi:hypothetical protein